MGQAWEPLAAVFCHLRMSNSGGSGPAGVPAGLPAHLQRPEVRAALEATRAKLALQQAAAGGHQQHLTQQQPNGSALGSKAGAVPPRQQQQLPRAGGAAHPAAAGRPGAPQAAGRPGAAPAAAAVARNNPIFGEEAIISPDKKLDREYTPTLADAIRAPTLEALVPDPGLPPVGDLFGLRPALPAYLEQGGVPGAPQLPAWDSGRPFLSGRFLLDKAQEQARSGGEGGRAGSAGAAVLESYPAHVQESLRECGWCWDCQCCEGI